jgi:hypothetical protein
MWGWNWHKSRDKSDSGENYSLHLRAPNTDNIRGKSPNEMYQDIEVSRMSQQRVDEIQEVVGTTSTRSTLKWILNFITGNGDDS